MYRVIIDKLAEWLDGEDRLPLVLRGARQVGKTWSVRELAKICNKNLIEFNFEKNLKHSTLFGSNEPEQILLEIESFKEITIDKDNTILFLDEIQVIPEL